MPHQGEGGEEEEDKPVVAFLGPKATYTHQAALSHFPPKDFNLLSLPSITSIFQSLQSQTSPHGVVPFENSSNGPVGFTLDLFADAESLYPDILIESEIYLPVRHCLAGRERTQDFSRIKKLYSHPQAWTQCSSFLTKHFLEVERVDTSSTSRAAELVAEDSFGTSAAISSSIAAEMNHLTILAEGIEDVKGNTTRFFVLRHASSSSSSSSLSPSSEGKREEGGRGNWKSLISFRLRHGRQSGALAESLAVFAKYGVNLTSILSRPSREAAWHYVFFVEVEGKKEQGSGLEEVLGELGKVVEGWRWLGSWVDRRE